jgi:hypothetical protein
MIRLEPDHSRKRVIPDLSRIVEDTARSRLDQFLQTLFGKGFISCHCCRKLDQPVFEGKKLER